MSDLEDADSRVAGWLLPLDDEAAPCGPDLEYDNDFLALEEAVKGKPESQFGPAEAPDWLGARAAAEALLDRTRDLRIAIHWLRAGLHIHGYAALPAGIRLLLGMLQGLWDHVHPLPDPDDGDPYGRVNALTLLREPAGLIGDLRAAAVVRDRAIGELSVRTIELAAGLGQPVGEEPVLGLEPVRRMVAAAVERTPALRAVAQESLSLARELTALAGERLGSDAPDLKPLVVLLNAVVTVMPAEAGAAAGADDGLGADAAGVAAGAGQRGLSGAVGSRDDALRAIDMVCAFLERTEPSNPAPLFLRRARQLVNHNFLQLMKELAPGALPDVARIVGIDPDSVESPESS